MEKKLDIVGVSKQEFKQLKTFPLSTTMKVIGLAIEESGLHF